ncbi:MAG: hypothetical protein HFI65_01560 [Lachnospiraceae bacterium]|nr:hypothetical protein [Lachnospiraceae bacterium]
MKKQIMAGMLLFCSLLLISCKDPASENKGTDGAVMMRPWYSEAEKGVLFYGNTDQIYSYDAQEGKLEAFCEKSGCRHDTEACMSVKLVRETPLLAVYQEDLYYIKVNEKTGKESLFCIDPEGGEKQILQELGGVDWNMGGPVIFDGRIYLFRSDAEAKKDGTGIAGGKLSLCRIELENGGTEIIWTQEYKEDQMAVWSLEHASDQYLYYWSYIVDVKTGDVSESGWHELDMEADKIKDLELEAFARPADWNGRRGVFFADDMEMPMGQESWEDSYRLADLETGETTKLEACTRPGPGIWLKDGFLYIDWSRDMRTGVWRLYDWKERTSSEIVAFEAKEETMFYPEVCVERDGKEMLIGRSSPNGVKGHYLISVEDFLAGGKEYELLCEVNVGNGNWAFQGSQ